MGAAESAAGVRIFNKLVLGHLFTGFLFSSQKCSLHTLQLWGLESGRVRGGILGTGLIESIVTKAGQGLALASECEPVSEDGSWETIHLLRQHVLPKFRASLNRPGRPLTDSHSDFKEPGKPSRATVLIAEGNITTEQQF